MCASLAHRGPDGEGVQLFPGVGFGHRRLAIIDVAGGAQPLSNEDGSVWVTYNGEIYNYQLLQEELTRAGHVFRTRSDTEVLVHGYEEQGLDFLKRLEGIFAFALYDARSRLVLLARDQLGVKPLFYGFRDGTLYFGSEIKAVLAGSGLPARPRREAVAEYLAFRYVAGTQTFFEGVQRLAPGHVAVWKDGQLHTSRYWDFPEPSAKPVHLADAVEELQARLSDAVRAQLMSEVPLGSFCSGGVDSGLVTGFATSTGARMNTFSVGFPEPGWDETALAQATSRRFNTEHHPYLADSEDFQAALPRLVYYNDEPLGQPNSVFIYLLSRYARQRVTVVLTGEGADELFGGYPRYQIARVRGYLGRAPRTALAVGAFGLRLAPDHRMRRLAALLPRPVQESLLFNAQYVTHPLVRDLTGLTVDDVLDERVSLVQHASVPGDAVASISRFEIVTYLQSLLDRVDRMSMANGLEARVPFLHLPLAEWALALPSALKVTGRHSKLVVKHLARRWLPAEVAGGAKSGFGVPLGRWFRQPSFRRQIEALRADDHPAAEFVSPLVTRRLVQEHLAGIRDHGETLWGILNLHLWFEVHAATGGAGRPDGVPDA